MKLSLEASTLPAITQITIINFIFERSLPKQVNNFTEGIVPQLNGIEVPLSTLLVICVEWK